MSRRLTHKEFVERVLVSNPNIEVVGEYVGMNTKIEFRCKEGHAWITTPERILRGCNCFECAKIQSSVRQRKSHTEFVEEVKSLHPDIAVLGHYVNAYTKIKFMCSKGHIWETAPYNVLNGCSCRICKGEKISLAKTRTTEQFVELMKEKGFNITILSEYTKATNKVLCRCNKCNHEWSATPANLLRGFGCPKCNQSKGENAVEEYLKTHKILYETQKRFEDCIDKRSLPFDFYLPNYNLCIEYQGSQHYIPTRRFGDEEKLIYRQKHDSIKREYCKNKGIELLEIPYTEFNNIAQIIEDVVKSKENKNIEEVA